LSENEELVLSLEKGVLQRAFTHPTNKRLAWLGDAVIYLAITEQPVGKFTYEAGGLDPERQKIINNNNNLKRSVVKRFYLKSKS